MSVTLTILCLLLPTLAFAVFWIKRRYALFQKLGAPFVKPRFPMGSIRDVGKIHFSMATKRIYDEMKGQGPYAGVFFFTMPVAIAIDIEFIKLMCIKDFSKFQDKGIYYNEKDEPLTAHLFALDGVKWKSMRHKLSPTFTSGKMKMMFGTVVDVGEKLRKKLIEICEDNQPVDINNVMSRYTTDVIGSCAFGIESNSLADENSLFYRMGAKVFREPRHRDFGQIFITAFPNFSRKLGLKLFSDDVSEFFIKVVRDTIELRKNNNIKRNDFMDLLINMMHKEGEKYDENMFTFNEIVAQAFIFFLAGLETSSNLMTFCLYELSLHPDIQNKARKEMQDVLSNYHGKITYEGIMEMKFLDQIINETLRKHPPVPQNIRKPNQDYLIPGTNVVLPKDTLVFIPVYAIHTDPEYFPDPDKFDPSRFTSENILKRPPCTFMPFGEGPRNCIGLRFGLMQVKIGLTVALMTMNVKLSNKTKQPMEIDPNNGMRSAMGGIWLNVERV